MPDPRPPHHPDGRRIETEMHTTASPEEVWKAWTDPATISKWFADEARGEARAGNTLVWTFRGFGDVPYLVKVADPPGHLILTGEVPGRGPFALEIVVRRSGALTILRLVNSGFLDGAGWDEEYEGVVSGWAASLALLKHYLERHRNAPRHAALLVHPAPVSPSDLYRYFTEPSRLAAWLTRDGAIGEVGQHATLVLQDGSPMSGSVIAATGREKALTWDEEDGTVVELKGFAGARQRMVGIRLTTWGPDAGRLARLERLLAPAVGRLRAQFDS